MTIRNLETRQISRKSLFAHPRYEAHDAVQKLKADGRTHIAKISGVPGGVGRNVAEALAKLGMRPLLISTIGNDLFGRELMRHFQATQMETNKIVLGDSPTAIYSALLNHQGNLEIGLGDMSIHAEITPSVITTKCSEVIKHASIVVLDGNLSLETMTAVLKICISSNVPVWFEPTEVRKAKKILQIPKEVKEAIRYISPNLRELMSITGIDLNCDLSKKTSSSGSNNTSTSDLTQLPSLFSKCFEMFPGLEVILFTRGKDGISVISRNDDDPGSLITLSHSAPDLKKYEIKSVSGAGDCLDAGFISGLLENMSLHQCAERGTFCAKKSLQSINNVPDNFTRD